jgi:A/G-specific adenine glycosylase
MESCKVGYPSIIGTKRHNFAAALIEWYERNARDLPWRRTRDPYRIWVSEIMLQQTRVETVVPYYHRFLVKYPSVAALASANEQELLAAWAGLGYYSRARNMQRAAGKIVEGGGEFPCTYETIRALPGIGDYTAAAIASLAYGLPHAVLDGNVMRVMARITGDHGDIGSQITRSRLQAAASARLVGAQPGPFNQAVMELGATVCIPRDPRCLVCPVQRYCEAFAQGCQRDLPVKRSKGLRKERDVTLLVVRRGARVLLWQQPPGSVRLSGFWELPEAGMLRSATMREPLGEFRHTITNTLYRVVVRAASVSRKPSEFTWMPLASLAALPLSTMSRKALLPILGRIG